MARTVVDVNDELLDQAQEILEAGTKKDTINAALAHVVTEHARRHEIEFWSRGGFGDLGDEEVMNEAWR